jgi:tRNA dimethylallyltransferase
MKNQTMKPKLIVILGATASGKSDLAVWLAKNLPGKSGQSARSGQTGTAKKTSRIGGEIISADSRQVYKGLDIGTGKITKKEMRGVPHHLLDVASPTSAKKTFTVEQFKAQAKTAIEQILKRGNVPIICGGTGFYIQAVVDDVSYPNVRPDFALRKKLQKRPAVELFRMLKKLDRWRAATIDPKNPRRLIRAIEIAKALGRVQALAEPSKRPFTHLDMRTRKPYDILQIGIVPDPKILKKRIASRLQKRLKSGMVTEARRLHANGISWKRMDELGLEYRYLARFLQKKISKTEMIRKLNSEIWKYASRQKTWFKRDSRIHWFTINQKKDVARAVKIFLGK